MDNSRKNNSYAIYDENGDVRLTLYENTLRKIDTCPALTIIPSKLPCKSVPRFRVNKYQPVEYSEKHI